LDTDIRVSNALNAAKSSKTPPWPTSMLRKAVMISLKSPRKRWHHASIDDLSANAHYEYNTPYIQIKPLTEEEKKQRLEELRSKMAEKRSKKAIEEAKEHKANEALRRKAGKVRGWWILICQRVDPIDREIRTWARSRKICNSRKHSRRLRPRNEVGTNAIPPIFLRSPSFSGIQKSSLLIHTFSYLPYTESWHALYHPEKIEDAKAKAAIKAQIEADKKARAEKAAREKALRDGQPLPESSSSTAPARAAAPAAGVAGKDFKETRLQIRMSTGGQPYTTTLSSDARKCDAGIGIFLTIELTLNSATSVLALREVAEYLAGQLLTVDPETVTIAQHFPRYVSEPWRSIFRSLLSFWSGKRSRAQISRSLWKISGSLLLL
jgi:hypothetical protein